jgi:hypothetical protein
MRSFRLIRPAIALLILGLLCGITFAEVPILAIDAVYPPVLSTTHANPVRITAGRFNQDIDALVFSDPRITAVLDPAPNLALDEVPQKNYGSFTVTVDPATPAGYYEVWASGRYGISNSRIVAVVSTPVELLSGSIDPKNPLEVKPGVCYVGTTKRSDKVVVKTKKTDHWPKCLIAAQVFDAATIPALTVTDSKQTVLSQLRAQGKRPILFEIPTIFPREPLDEVYLRIYDFLYRGAETAPFALVIDPPENHPLLTRSAWKPPFSVFEESLATWPVVDPNTIPAGGLFPAPAWQTSIELTSQNPIAQIEFPVAEGLVYECEVFSAADGQMSDIRIVADRVSPAPTPEQLVEIQANTNAPAGTALDPNLEQRIKDYRLRIQKIGREVITIAEDGPAAGTRAVGLTSPDPIASIPAGPVTKNVRLSISDLQMTASRKWPTRLTLRVGPAVPRFHAVGHWVPDTNNAVQAKTTGVALSKGGQCALQVSIRRAGGFAGPIQVTCEGLPPGVSMRPAIIAPGQSETQVIFYAEENATAWVGTIQPLAKGTWTDPNNAPQEIAVPIRAATIALSASGDRGLPQSRLSSQWQLKVIEQEIAPIQIRAGEGPEWVLEIPLGGSGKLPIKAVRRAGGDQKGVMRPQNLPAKVAFAEFELPPNAAEATPEIKVAADATPGEYTVWFQTEIILKQSLHPESHARLVAYRDRIQAKLADPNWAGDRPMAEKIIAETNPKIEALAKEIAPRDFPTFLSSAPFRLRIVPAAEAPK